MCGQGDLLTFENEKYVVQVEPAILILEFVSIGNEFPITLPFEGPICLMPHCNHQSESENVNHSIVSDSLQPLRL